MTRWKRLGLISLAIVLAFSCGPGSADPAAADPVDIDSAGPVPARVESTAAPVQRPDVLLVIIDTLRADHVGTYGHTRDTTPVLDALAAGGSLFETAYAPLGSTTPSIATIFTGLAPLSHGVVSNGSGLSDGPPTLAEAFSEGGYRTVAFVSSLMAGSRWGLSRGFQHLDETFPRREGQPDDERVIYRSPLDTVDAALAWLESTPGGERPLFLWLHLFDPHSPYEPPEEHAALFPPEKPGRIAEVRAAYEAEVHFSDQQVGRFVAALESRAGAAGLLVAVVADHGEGLMDHGWPLHSRYTYEEEVRVPFILRWPGKISPGRRVEQPVWLGDLPQTLLALCGLDPLPGAEGIDLRPWLLGDEAIDPERPLFLHRPWFKNGREKLGEKGWGLGLRQGKWKYFEALEENRRELYDLDADPRERQNLSESKSAEVDRLSGLIRDWVQTQSRADEEPIPESLSEEDLEALKSLGYVR